MVRLQRVGLGLGLRCMRRIRVRVRVRFWAPSGRATLGYHWVYTRGFIHVGTYTAHKTFLKNET